MTINNTKHIIMDEDDIKSAIVDYLFRTQMIEAEHEHIKIYRCPSGGVYSEVYKAKIDVPIEPDQLNLQED